MIQRVITFIYVLALSLSVGFAQNFDQTITKGKQLIDQANYSAALDLLWDEIIRAEFVGDFKNLVRLRNLLGESYANLNDCGKATAVIENNLRLLDSLILKNEEELRAETYYYIGRAKGGCVRAFEDGLHWLRKAAQFHKRENLELQLADDFSFIAYIFEAKGSYDSAIFYCEQTLQLRRKHLAEDDLEISHPFFILAKSYDGKGDIHKAIDLHNKAISIRLRHLGENHPTVSNSYHSIGVVYQKLGNYQRALQYFEKALLIRKRTLGKDHVNIAGSYYTIGNVYNSLLQYRRAIQYIEEGNRITERRYVGGVDILPTYQALLAKLYMLSGDSTEAEENCRKAEHHLKKTLPSDHPFRGIVLGLLGEYYALTGNVFHAIENYQQATVIFQKAYGPGSIREADVDAKLASLYFKHNSFENGLTHVSQSNYIFDSKLGKVNPRSASNHHLVGKVLMEKGDYDGALHSLQKAMSSLAVGFKDTVNTSNNPPINAVENKAVAMQVAIDKGRTWNARFNQTKDSASLQKAWHCYQYGFELYDELLSSHTQESNMSELITESRKYFDEGMEILFQLLQLTKEERYQHEAWTLSEKSKAVRLLAKWHDQQSMLLGNVPDSLIQLESDLLAEISFFQNRLLQTKKKGDATIDDIETKLFQLSEQHDQLKRSLAKQFPAYYYHKYNYEITPLDNVVKRLSSKTILSFYITDHSLFTFVVRQDDVLWKRSILPSEWNDVIEKNHQALSDLQFISSQPTLATNALHETSSQLFEWLIGDVLPELTEHLVIIPDKQISLVNFGTLINNHPNELFPYLLSQAAISYAYSASFLFNGIAVRQWFRNSFAGFAPSYHAFTLAKKDSVLTLRNGNTNLPGAQLEVQQLASLMNGNRWIAEDATELNFRLNAPVYEILHLAMHSHLNYENPELSELIFNSANDSLYDGHLTISEIYNLRIKASMVVLSACSSGTGKSQMGEGPVSLSRAFHYAGASSVVMSLWRVPDEVTRKIMVLFYKGMRKGLRKDVALRQAQLQFVKEEKDPLLKHPFFWSGFVVTGSTDPFSPSIWFYMLWISVAIAFIGVSLFVYRKSFRKQIL